MVFRLVLVRHGQSVYNVDSKFTGWADVPLTSKGAAEVARVTSTALHTVNSLRLSLGCSCCEGRTLANAGRQVVEVKGV